MEDKKEISTNNATNPSNKKRKENNPSNNTNNKKSRQIKLDNEKGVLTQKELEETTYYIKDGFRMVKPYFFEFQTFVKQRMFGKNLIDVLSTEFKRYKREYFIEAMKDGRLLVNNERVDEHEIIKHGQMIQHTVHRHEPPVLNKEVKIVHQDEDLIVVDKPPSITIHPCGRYRHNSVVFILAHEKGLNKLFPCHRLDRLTSGVCLLARNKEMAQKITTLIMSHQMEKHYLALVDGQMEVGKEILIDQPLFNFKGSGICTVDPINGKEAKTKVVVMKSNEKYSLVSCFPLTGRTHQIRVHLKWLGHPIANDPCYGKDVPIGTVAVDSEGHTLDYYEELLQNKIDMLKKKSEQDYPENTDTFYEKDPHCDLCRLDIPDPKFDSLLLYLHAYSYSSKDPSHPFKYVTEMPDWVELAN